MPFKHPSLATAARLVTPLSHFESPPECGCLAHSVPAPVVPLACHIHACASSTLCGVQISDDASDPHHHRASPYAYFNGFILRRGKTISEYREHLPPSVTPADAYTGRIVVRATHPTGGSLGHDRAMWRTALHNALSPAGHCAACTTCLTIASSVLDMSVHCT